MKRPARQAGQLGHGKARHSPCRRHPGAARGGLQDARPRSCRVRPPPPNPPRQNDLQIIAEIWSGRSPIIEKAVGAGDVRMVGDTLAARRAAMMVRASIRRMASTRAGVAAAAPDLKSWRDLRATSIFSAIRRPRQGPVPELPFRWICKQTYGRAARRLLELQRPRRRLHQFPRGHRRGVGRAISSAYDRGAHPLRVLAAASLTAGGASSAKVEQDPVRQTRRWDTIVSGEGPLCLSDFLAAAWGLACRPRSAGKSALAMASSGAVAVPCAPAQCR